MKRATALSPRARCAVLHDLGQDTGLELEWNELWVRAKGLFHQSYSTCVHCWQLIARPEKSELLCILLWEDDKLALAWPLVRYTKGPLRMIRPLTPCGGESNSILADAEMNVPGLVAAAWATLREKAGADVIYLPLVRVSSALDDAVPVAYRAANEEPDAAPHAQLSRERNWESYRETLSKGPWQEIVKKSRRLKQRGECEFRWIDPVEYPEQSAHLIEWMLAEKQRWVARARKSHTWVTSDQYKAFVVRSITDPSSSVKYVLCAIMLDHKPIAVKLLAICPDVVEYVIGAYDSSPEISKLSPGMILDEFWMKKVFDLRMDVDFGSGQESYKLFWSKGNCAPLSTYRIPITLRGRLVLALFAQLKKLASLRSGKRETAMTAPVVE